MISVYLSSPVSDYQKPWNIKIAKILEKHGGQVYLPQKITPNLDHKNFPLQVFSSCLEMIQLSNLCLLLFPYGRDCAWEVGYFKGINRPTVVLVEELNIDQRNRLCDWMVKGGINEIITTSKQTLKIFNKDVILQTKKIHFIKKLGVLPNVLEKIYQGYLKNIKPPFIGIGTVVIQKGKVLLVQEKEDSKFYLRKKGMWGFPTTLWTKDTPPERQSLISLFKETCLRGKDPCFISKQTIPNAVGIFYKVEVEAGKKQKAGQWFNIKDVVNERLYLRPTYPTVLQKLM